MDLAYTIHDALYACSKVLASATVVTYSSSRESYCSIAYCIVPVSSFYWSTITFTYLYLTVEQYQVRLSKVIFLQVPGTVMVLVPGT